ncbi:MAG: methylated-DNA--[protein]-cysteine S-methyltransferase [Pseudomonadota bacterium]
MFITHTPIGKIGFKIEDEKVVEIHLTASGKTSAPKTPVENIIVATLANYFNQATVEIDLPFELRCTAFQKRVYLQLQKIPAGQTTTYGALAKKLKSHPRAVGQALRANPLPLLFPCHRIIGINGLTGFSGQTQGRAMAIKQHLLEHEGAKI